LKKSNVLRQRDTFPLDSRGRVPEWLGVDYFCRQSILACPTAPLVERNLMRAIASLLERKLVRAIASLLEREAAVL
jgi:hypothetical protein